MSWIEENFIQISKIPFREIYKFSAIRLILQPQLIIQTLFNLACLIVELQSSRNPHAPLVMRLCAFKELTFQTSWAVGHNQRTWATYSSCVSQIGYN